MNRRRRRLLWTIRWYFSEFRKHFLCGCWKKDGNNEIPMTLISLNENEDENGDEIESTPFLLSLPKLLDSQNTSLTSCVQCGRVFPDFFHGIRVFYRTGPWQWTCGRCAAIGTPSKPIIVIPNSKI
uniref:Uncharacterized protein n=1 Tax=Panagrolaimus sp. PS1159 TaxID=55785 RepID=A0AC35GDP8_9BILA